jgi:hypothetical protein
VILQRGLLLVKKVYSSRIDACFKSSTSSPAATIIAETVEGYKA